MKEFLSSPKKTVILGLVASILMLVTTSYTLYELIGNLYIIGGY